jgi:hypothetical protein
MPRVDIVQDGLSGKVIANGPAAQAVFFQGLFSFIAIVLCDTDFSTSK